MSEWQLPLEEVCSGEPQGLVPSSDLFLGAVVSLAGSEEHPGSRVCVCWR